MNDMNVRVQNQSAPMVHWARQRHSSLLLFFVVQSLSTLHLPVSPLINMAESVRWIIGLNPSAAPASSTAQHPHTHSNCWIMQEDWTWRECLERGNQRRKSLSLTAADEDTSEYKPNPAETPLHAYQRLKTTFEFMDIMHWNASSTEETLDLK